MVEVEKLKIGEGGRGGGTWDLRSVSPENVLEKERRFLL